MTAALTSRRRESEVERFRCGAVCHRRIPAPFRLDNLLARPQSTDGSGPEPGNPAASRPDESPPRPALAAEDATLLYITGHQTKVSAPDTLAAYLGLVFQGAYRGSASEFAPHPITDGVGPLAFNGGAASPRGTPRGCGSSAGSTTDSR